MYRRRSVAFAWNRLGTRAIASVAAVLAIYAGVEFLKSRPPASIAPNARSYVGSAHCLVELPVALPAGTSGRWYGYCRHGMAHGLGVLELTGSPAGGAFAGRVEDGQLSLGALTAGGQTEAGVWRNGRLLRGNPESSEWNTALWAATDAYAQLRPSTPVLRGRSDLGQERRRALVNQWLQAQVRESPSSSARLPNT